MTTLTDNINNMKKEGKWLVKVGTVILGLGVAAVGYGSSKLYQTEDELPKNETFERVNQIDFTLKELVDERHIGNYRLVDFYNRGADFQNYVDSARTLVHERDSLANTESYNTYLKQNKDHLDEEDKNLGLALLYSIPGALASLFGGFLILSGKKRQRLANSLETASNWDGIK